VVAWGWNASGQTNVPAGLSNVVAVAAGSRHCLALKSDGTVVGWGAGPNNNDSNPERGQATIPSGMAGVVAIAGGDFNSITLGLNVPPQASSLSVTGALSSDLPITLPVWDPNGDALSCRIMTFPTTGSIFQYTDSGRGDLLSPANCLVMDPEGRVLFAPTPQPYVWPYATFTCQASDGEADSALGTVTVNLVPEPSLNPGTVTFGPTGSFTMSFLGVTNAGYRVWGSTNLSNWAFLGSATQSDIGVFIYGDTGATNAPCRFYRVTCP
jgi:hypothetical protein